eukprot:scaffold325985_cov61-Tisochrysis_lutea.AAC.2
MAIRLLLILWAPRWAASLPDRRRLQQFQLNGPTQSLTRRKFSVCLTGPVASTQPLATHAHLLQLRGHELTGTAPDREDVQKNWRGAVLQLLLEFSSCDLVNKSIHTRL